ncbi:MAG TPA: IclR family transcriptional regulator C-terminal domain-containing protein [Intrasporangium sp.]|uniref:IclR family transcriptional regulator domain-containing protein n=1 Tax=Intrasporangium sp. TaxID=1925024 RepID=UPI002D781ECC|nr:IclR family transcriptional regulator C-terminal domain-containing protein [Intrasporangium sp.]HET7398653.1 IclR family transcriptional regulator C-terminal domain-containing protein [Intrasporangium sp.]
MAGTSGPEAREHGDAHVQSLGRGLSVIESFDADNEAATLSDVARRTGLTRATARRFLLTLVDLGYMRTDGRLFSLTPRVLRLGHAYLSSMGLPQIAQPHLEALSARLGESVSVAVLDGSDIVYVARVATRRIMTVGISVGTRFPAYATSMGRVLLAGLTREELDHVLTETELRPLTDRTIVDEAALREELDRVRSQGFSLVDEELELGLRSLAAPVRGRAGEVVAAVNVSTQVRSVRADGLEEQLPALLETAAAISADLQATHG